MKLIDILFCSVHGTRVLIPAFAPIAAWIALWDGSTLQSTVEIEPLALITYGDPASLTLEAKTLVLKSIQSQANENPVWRISVDSQRLQLFASQDLGRCIHNCWKACSQKRFRQFLLDIILTGKISSCRGLAREVFRNSDPDSISRIYGLQTLAALEDATELRAAAKSLISDIHQISNEQAAAMASVLFHKFISVSDLLWLIDNAKPEKRNSVTGFSHRVDDFWELCSSKGMSGEFIQGVSALCFQPPLLDRKPLSRKHYELARHLARVVRAELETLSPCDPIPDAVRSALRVVRLAGSNADYRLGHGPSLQDVIGKLPRVRKELFLIDVMDSLGLAGSNTARRAIPPSNLWMASSDDLGWLYNDIANHELLGIRLASLREACRILKQERLLDERADELKGLCSGQNELLGELSRALAEVREEQSGSTDLRNACPTDAEAAWLAFARRLRDVPDELMNPSEATGSALGPLWSLSQYLLRQESAASDWRGLISAFGEKVAVNCVFHACRSGFPREADQNLI